MRLTYQELDAIEQDLQTYGAVRLSHAHRLLLAIREAYEELNALGLEAYRCTHAEARWLTRKEAARHIGINRQTLRHLHARGEAPRAQRLGRQWLYDVDDLEVWVATRNGTG